MQDNGPRTFQKSDKGMHEFASSAVQHIDFERNTIAEVGAEILNVLLPRDNAKSVRQNAKLHEFNKSGIACRERRPMQNKNIALSRLLKSGKIGLHELAAAERWERDYLRSQFGSSSTRDFQSPRGGLGNNVSDAILSAWERRRRAAILLGRLGEDRLQFVIIDGATLKELATASRMSQESSTAKFAESLKVLSKFYFDKI